MPDFNPANPGDIVYPKYAVVTTQSVLLGTFTKGNLYEADISTGNVDPATPTTFKDGFLQAMDTPDPQPTVNGADSIQFLGPRTRMMFIAPAGLVVGQDVKYVSGTGIVAGLKTDALYIGKIFEIYNLQADNITPKYITALNDKVIVETVQA